ncbi:MAG: hypothetical protein LAN59_01485 [Acidobacteriia bacterium]|nr:hypothetical protein [Terriglobia bacterium]
MKTAIRTAALLLLGLLLARAPRALAQEGSIEFVARATPSGGLDEPVRGFPFYLLGQSFEAIGHEAEASYPKPDLDAFVDHLDVSPQLKAWMKKRRWTSLSGEAFTRQLHADDIMEVPEFYKAYSDRVAGDRTVRWPKPKFKPSDKTKDPAKYQRLSDEYTATVHQFIDQNPQTISGIDINLQEIDPGHRWNTLEATRNSDVHRRTLDLAQSKYLVGRVESDLQGQGSFHGLAPGTYWLSTLDVAASVGDVRPQWDVPLTVRAGQTSRLTLSNTNAVPPSHPSP